MDVCGSWTPVLETGADFVECCTSEDAGRGEGIGVLRAVMRAGVEPTCGLSSVGVDADGITDGVTIVTSHWNDEEGGASPTLAASSAAKKTAALCRQSEMVHPLARKRTKASGVPAWEAVTGARPPG